MARASLQFIMGVDGDDDRPGSSHNGDKRDRIPASTPASASHPGSRPSDPTHHPSYATSPGQQNDINPSSDTSGPGPRRSRSSRPSRSTTASSSSSRPTNSRRRSTASLESAEQAGYASSSSVGGSGGGPTMTSSNYPSRPMHHTAPGESPVKLTPITGRVSRAKKGVPVHTCDQCRPPKVFTRAEHLRRHQLSHQTPAHECTYPGCDRAFHRQDLLTRHLQKHAQEGDKASGRGGQRPREPSQTLPEQPQTLQSTQPPLDPMSQMSVAAYTTPAPSYMNNSGAYTPSMRDSGRAAGTPSSSHEPSAGGYGSPSSDQNQPSYGGYAPNFRYTSSSPASSSAGGQMINQMTPRTPAVPLVLITQGLDAHMQLDNPPDLVHTIPDISPWASSTDSSYSTTPATDNSRQLRHAWIPNHASPMGDWQHQSFLGYSPSTGPDPGAMDPLASSTSYLFSPSDITPQPHALSQTSNFDYLDVPVGGARSMTVNSPRFQDPSVSSVRSPSPITTTTMSAETLVAPSLALPIGRSGMPAGLGRQKVLAVDASANAYDTFQGIGGAMGFTVGSAGSFTELNGMGGGGCAASAVPISPLPRTIRNAIPNYINVYWNRFHIIYPVVHRASFEAAPEAVLSYAIAAVATQFLDSKEDRLRGNLLHEHAWQEAKCCSAWTTQTMQAIILCEFFARFRGRKVVTRPSKMFESLYSRVLDQNNTLFDEASFEDGLPIANEERWHTWIEAEVRRRLLSMCFFLDNHTSKYQEQPLLRGFDLLQAGPTPPIPMASTSAALWGAPSADSWAAMLRADPLAGKPGFLPHPDVLSPSSIQALPIFDRAVILAFESLRLPRRTVMGKDSAASSGAASASNTPEGQWPDDTESMADNSDVEDRISYLFGGCPIANTYLALNHTPLHDLLAVSGDTWIFSQKILPATSFLEHKKRLKIWAEGRAQQRSAGSTSMSVAKAVGFAARALVAFLERDSDETLSDGGQHGWLYDLSEYWAVYVCSLICWAYGRRYPGRCDDGDASENEAVGWLRRVAGTRADELPRATRESSRRAAGGVVKMIRRRLEVECVEGARSRLFVDAVGVLKKLEEGANWRWF